MENFLIALTVVGIQALLVFEEVEVLGFTGCIEFLWNQLMISDKDIIKLKVIFKLVA